MICCSTYLRDLLIHSLLPHITTHQQAQQEPTDYYQISLQIYRLPTAAKTLWSH